MISIALGITFILFILISVIFGMNRAVGFLPLLLLLAFLISFFGFIIINFFPLILIMIGIAYYRRRKNPNRGRGFYYKTYRAEDFEEFFRQNGQQFGGNNGYYGGNSQGQGNFGNYFEDKTKYYSVLGVHQGATKDEIKKAFRDLAKQHHPDKFSNESEDVKAYHEKKFKEINEAYEKLTKE
ncbi:J domain-containing protein [Cetobacterium sp. SF1]|uniref:J domain-containing protein n=1 Tax=Cetobacterium sp. SF1 TaxID=3417654 RepID=UPI003CF23AC2